MRRRETCLVQVRGDHPACRKRRSRGHLVRSTECWPQSCFRCGRSRQVEQPAFPHECQLNPQESPPLRPYERGRAWPLRDGNGHIGSQGVRHVVHCRYSLTVFKVSLDVACAASAGVGALVSLSPIESRQLYQRWRCMETELGTSGSGGNDGTFESPQQSGGTEAVSGADTDSDAYRGGP